MQGTVKFYSGAGKGFGFITPDQPGLIDQFFHIRSVVLPPGVDQADVEDRLQSGSELRSRSGKGLTAEPAPSG